MQLHIEAPFGYPHSIADRKLAHPAIVPACLEDPLFVNRRHPGIMPPLCRKNIGSVVRRSRPKILNRPARGSRRLAGVRQAHRHRRQADGRRVAAIARGPNQRRNRNGSLVPGDPRRWPPARWLEARSRRSKPRSDIQSRLSCKKRPSKTFIPAPRSNRPRSAIFSNKCRPPKSNCEDAFSE